MNDILPLPESPPATREPPPMPLELQIYFDPAVYERVQVTAERMSKAQGVTPQHLLGKPEACFFVCEAALGWHLRPGAVARATYQTPGGQLGFMGTLIAAIIEQSGRLEPGSGGLRHEHFGDWKQVQGKFEIRASQKDNEKKYAAATWTDADAAKGDCGVTIKARLRGENVDREYSMRLTQAFPRNSTLWATDPMTQLVYLAQRRFANLRMPGVLMGFRDPLDDAPQGEREMGAVERAEDGTMPMPQPKQHEVPPPSPGPDEPEPAPGTPATGAPPSSDAPNLITANALRMINKLLADRELLPQFNQHYGVADPSELPMSKVNEAIGWIQAQSSAANA